MMKRQSAILAILLLAASGLALAEPVENFNEGVTAPYLIPSSRVAPEYPPAAFDARLEGAVTVAALVLKDGSVSYVETLDSTSPSVGFEQATAAAVEQWRFEPGQKDGEPIDAFTIVRLNFRRTGGSNPSGYVSAGFMPLDMMGASIVASMAPPSADSGQAAGAGIALAATSPDGPYHPSIPSGLFPGASYLRSDWWPDREFYLTDSTGANQPNFDIQSKD
jgi:TonB family protein